MPITHAVPTYHHNTYGNTSVELRMGPNKFILWILQGKQAGASPTGGRGGQDPALLKTAGDDPQKCEYSSIFFLETYNFWRFPT